MKETTKKRHEAVRAAFNALPAMPIMKAYLRLAEQFGFSDETIRQILRKKHPP